MRTRLLAVLSASLLAAACSGGGGDGPTPYDDIHDPSNGDINEGAPRNDTLPDDNKADAVYPPRFEVRDQSPVKSQGSRGVCSIFAATALVENLYIKAGMPVAEADFSEQYLQWAAKNLPGASFKNTSGSTSELNLRMVVQHGTVKESAWRYESFQWNTSNDPECTDGENLPTRCYTNGAPPVSATEAQKFKLPRTRFVNTNSIKAHIHTNKTGVNVGLTFFYQAWNHRKSVLPVSTDLWQRGIVTMPNGKDEEESLKNRAGHAIQIVGWDDELEVEMRDGEGKTVLDAQGKPRLEKGFWIFKNSWGTTGFGIDHPTGAGYGYLSMAYVKKYGSAVTADVPVLRTAEVCDDPDGIDEDGDNRANCDDSDCATHPACTGAGSTHTYTATPAAAIPDNNTTGVSSTIEVGDAGTIADVKVTVDITHTFRGDLVVTLEHDGTTKTLIANSGGSAKDLKQTFAVSGFTGALSGRWTLKVVDTARIDTGTLNSWQLEVATN
ncbi:MAG: proprotein convertase P-domain-containing protein [Deltaproteobacteria bacterium]|nr:proprotein convertase P-domain-containing protein [Deltaproteobacteria bacterium]MCW5807157.1 proprotein convertase P-domain-containing protein [Deltaproteobacteria bacterium]